MPALELEPDVEQSNDQSQTLSGPIIGIIYPPPEVRSILLLKQNYDYNRTQNIKINITLI
jgi:hypothetical protein